eukprot:gene16126-7484_t
MELESELNDCDIILQLLDENSAELQLDFERAVDEVQENIVECPDCQKVYKTKGGRRRHQKAKHPDSGHKSESPELDLTQYIYENLVNNGAKSLASDLCLPPAERAAFWSYTFKVDNCHATNGLHLAQKLFKVLVHKANAAKFYKIFYAQFVAKANSYLQELSEPQAVFLAMKLADSLLAVQEEQKPSADMGMPQLEDVRMIHLKSVLEKHVAVLQKSNDDGEQYQCRLCLRISGIDLPTSGKSESSEECLKK